MIKIKRCEKHWERCESCFTGDDKDPSRPVFYIIVGFSEKTTNSIKLCSNCIDEFKEQLNLRTW